MAHRTLANLAAISLLALGSGGPALAQLAPGDSVRRLVNAGLPDEAFAYARTAARAAPDDPGALAALAVGAMAVEDYDAAVEAADAAVALRPEISACQLVLGQSYLSHARANFGIGAIGKVKKGWAAVERAIERNPDNLEARHTLMQFLLQAPGIAGGSREGARRQADEIERRDRRRGLLARVEVAVAGGDVAELARVLDDSAPLAGTSADSGATLLGALLAAAGALEDEDGRERLTQRIYAAHADHPVALYHRARLWVTEGERLEEAERLLLRYLDAPEWRAGAATRAGAHWRLAQLYERQDQKAYAKEQYRLAASLDPRLKRGRRTSERLEREL